MWWALGLELGTQDRDSQPTSGRTWIVPAIAGQALSHLDSWLDFSSACTSQSPPGPPLPQHPTLGQAVLLCGICTSALNLPSLLITLSPVNTWGPKGQPQLNPEATWARAQPFGCLPRNESSGPWLKFLWAWICRQASRSFNFICFFLWASQRLQAFICSLVAKNTVVRMEWRARGPYMLTNAYSLKAIPWAPSLPVTLHGDLGHLHGPSP